MVLPAFKSGGNILHIQAGLDSREALLLFVATEAISLSLFRKLERGFLATEMWGVQTHRAITHGMTGASKKYG